MNLKQPSHGFSTILATTFGLNQKPAKLRKLMLLKSVQVVVKQEVVEV